MSSKCQATTEKSGFVAKVEHYPSDVNTPENWLKNTVNKQTDGESGAITIKKNGFIFEG
jgi:hypothetical protein